MATYYYDFILGNNANDGSLATPKQYPTSSDGAAGDSFLLKAGQTFYLNVAFGWTPKMATSVAGARTYVGVYGATGNSPNYAIIDNLNSSGPTINISAGSNNSNLLIEDIWVAGTGHSNVPLYLHAFSSDLNNITLRRVRALGKVNRTNPSCQLASDSTETIFCKNITFEDCVFTDNGGHGLLITSTIGAVVRRCLASNNGLATGAHGFSSFKLRDEVTSGWGGGATIFTRATTRTNISAVMVTSGASAATYPRLIQNTSTPTLPNAGEWGISAGTLYINLNSVDPAGQTISIAYGTLSNISYEFCTSTLNRAYSGYTFHEGHGIALDDFSSNCSIIGCLLINNEGNGISINRGDSNTIIGNVISNNIWPGININRGQNNVIYNNTITRNNTLGTHNGFSNTFTGEINAFSMATGTVIKNNIITSTRANGVSYDASSSSSSSAAYNNITGNSSTAVTTVTATNTTTVSPATDVYNVPVASLRAAGTFISTYVGFNGKEFKTTPSIGAIEYYSSTPTIVTKTVSGTNPTIRAATGITFRTPYQ